MNFASPTNRLGRQLRAGLLLLCAACWAHPAARAEQKSPAALRAVLAQMDVAAKNFRSAQADFEWDQYERVVDNTDTQTGTIDFLRQGGATEMAAHVKQFNGQPDAKEVVYNGGVLEFYQPAIDQMTVLHAGKNQERFESFLTLGFGGSGSAMEKSWEITDQGVETIDGVQTVKLDLVGKQASVRSMFTHITVWIDPARAISLKQQFFEPSGDVRTAFYRNIRYNKRIAASAFRIKTDAKTSTVQK
jgi:outer membrane lipoprotein-sorting protein